MAMMGINAAEERVYTGDRHFMEPPPEAAAMKNMPLPPRMAFPPQAVMDSMKDDGPLSVAYGMIPHVDRICSKNPAPSTPQYLGRFESMLPHPAMNHERAMPCPSTAVAGYVQASSDSEYTSDLDTLHIAMNELRLVFASIDGWVLQFWRTQEDYMEGRSGIRGCPRPFAWWDLRGAYDVDIDSLNWSAEICPHRFRILMRQGLLYFRVEHPEDVPTWYAAIKRIIQDAAIQNVRSLDRHLHQEKRWPAAVGIARALVESSPIGERALALTFQCYDIDYDCHLRAGELMVLIQELLAGIIHVEQRSEGADRDGAVASAAVRVSDSELFQRAQGFLRRCSHVSKGRIEQEEFLQHGHVAMLEALDLPYEDLLPSDGACSLM